MSNENNEGRDEKGRFTEKNLWSIAKKRVGHPKKYPTPEELAFTALEYFEWCATTKNKITMSGLRVYIDFSRENWREYKTYPEYVDTMNTIESLLEAEWEAKLGWAGSTQGAIFWLKNKASWRDETTQHQTLTNVTASFGNTLQSAQESGTDTSGDKQ